MANLNVTTTGTRPALHPPDQNHGMAPLGKFGERKMKDIHGDTVRYTSATSRSSLKKLADRVVDFFSGSDGKVRSLNRTHREASRLMRNIGGRMLKRGANGGNAKLQRDCRKLEQKLVKLENSIAGFDRKAFLVAQAKQMLVGMQGHDAFNLMKKSCSVTFDVKAAQNYGAELGSVLTDEFGDVFAARAGQDIQSANDGAHSLRTAVLAAGEAWLVSQLALSPTYAAAIARDIPDISHVSVTAGEIRDNVTEGQWPALVDLLKRQPPIAPPGEAFGWAVSLVRKGMTTADVNTLVQQGGFKLDEAVAIASDGARLADVKALETAGCGPQLAVRLARAGCSAKSYTDFVAAGRTDAEIEVLSRSGWSSDFLRNQPPVLTADFDMASLKRTSGGNANQVFSIDQKQPGSPSKAVYFCESETHKPAVQVSNKLGVADRHGNWAMAKRNLASAALDRLLGFNMVPITRPALIQMSDGRAVAGTVMDRAPGRQAADTPKTVGTFAPSEFYTTNFDEAYHGDLAALNDALAGKGEVARLDSDGSIEIAKVTQNPDVALDAKGLRGGLLQLQYMDMLAGQLDRSANNYFLSRDANGKITVKAIDNDMAWGTRPGKISDVPAMKSEVNGSCIRLLQLPPIADQATYDAFAKLDDNALRGMLGDHLAPAEVAAAFQRLSDIRAHLESLKQQGKIYADLDAPAAAAEYAKVCDDTNSYLLRDAGFYAPASGGQSTPADGADQVLGSAPKTLFEQDLEVLQQPFDGSFDGTSGIDVDSTIDAKQ